MKHTIIFASSLCLLLLYAVASKSGYPKDLPENSYSWRDRDVPAEEVKWAYLYASDNAMEKRVYSGRVISLSSVDSTTTSLGVWNTEQMNSEFWKLGIMYKALITKNDINSGLAVWCVTEDSFKPGELWGMTDTFDGIGVIVNTRIGTDGKLYLHIYGVLNDGSPFLTTDDQSAEDLSLSLYSHDRIFGHCELPLHYVQSAATLSLSYEGKGLQVSVDSEGKLRECFTRMVHIERGRHLVLTAKTSRETSDTFGIYSISATNMGESSPSVSMNVGQLEHHRKMQQQLEDEEQQLSAEFRKSVQKSLSVFKELHKVDDWSQSVLPMKLEAYAGELEHRLDAVVNSWDTQRWSHSISSLRSVCGDLIDPRREFDGYEEAANITVLRDRKEVLELWDDVTTQVGQLLAVHAESISLLLEWEEWYHRIQQEESRLLTSIQQRFHTLETLSDSQPLRESLSGSLGTSMATQWVLLVVAQLLVLIIVYIIVYRKKPPTPLRNNDDD